MIGVLEVLVAVASLAVVASGMAKVVAPDSAGTAMASAGLIRPGVGARAGRLLGAAEVAVGLSGLGVDAPLGPIPVAGLYAAFATFVVVLRRRDGAAGCGCFGATDAPPTVVHVTVDAVIALGLAIAAALDARALVSVAADTSLPAAIAWVVGAGGGAAVLLWGLAWSAARAAARSAPSRFRLVDDEAPDRRTDTVRPAPAHGEAERATPAGGAGDAAPGETEATRATPTSASPPSTDPRAALRSGLTRGVGGAASVATGADVSDAEPLPSLQGIDLAGDVVTVDLAPGRTVVAFLSTTCTVCARFWDAIAAGERLPEVALVIVTPPGPDGRPMLPDAVTVAVPVVASSDARRDFVVPGVPYFVLIDGPEGRVTGRGAAESWTELQGLLAGRS